MKRKLPSDNVFINPPNFDFTEQLSKRKMPSLEAQGKLISITDLVKKFGNDNDLKVSVDVGINVSSVNISLIKNIGNYHRIEIFVSIDNDMPSGFLRCNEENKEDLDSIMFIINESDVNNEELDDESVWNSLRANMFEILID